MKNLQYVAIEGTIGVGKTSLANLFSEKLGAKLILEAFEDNPFLTDFYEDPESNAFQTQLWFLLQRYQQQQELRQVDMFQNLVVTDYMFVKDRLFAALNLNEKEMSLYDSVAKMMEKNIIHPDLVIFLQADTETLMKNISRRGRDFEKNMSEDYIDALNQVYNEYFFVSGYHKLGLEQIHSYLSNIALRSQKEDNQTTSLTIIGRPNAGKSTLFNALLNKERSTVSDVPGTTRDKIEENLEANDRIYVITDTAGIPRKKQRDQIDRYSSEISIKSLEILILP